MSVNLFFSIEIDKKKNVCSIHLKIDMTDAKIVDRTNVRKFKF